MCYVEQQKKKEKNIWNPIIQETVRIKEMVILQWYEQ